LAKKNFVAEKECFLVTNLIVAEYMLQALSWAWDMATNNFWQQNFCCKKDIFLAMKLLLLKTYIFGNETFVAKNIYFWQRNFCCEKHIFLATSSYRCKNL